MGGGRGAIGRCGAGRLLRTGAESPEASLRLPASAPRGCSAVRRSPPPSPGRGVTVPDGPPNEGRSDGPSGRWTGLAPAEPALLTPAEPGLAAAGPAETAGRAPSAGGDGGCLTVDAADGLEGMTGGLPEVVGRPAAEGRTIVGPEAVRSGALALPAINSLSLATSSSVMLARAEPLSWMPAREHNSTSSLLSSFSSFARV